MAGANGFGGNRGRQLQNRGPRKNWLVEPLVQGAASAAGLRLGQVAGFGRGSVHSVEGLGQGAIFAARLAATPLDRYLSPPGRSASDQLINTVRMVADYTRDARKNPHKILDDAKWVASQMRRDLDPTATAPASTFSGEFQRNFNIGQNQGEATFDIGSMIVGGPAAKVVGRMADARRLSSPAKFVAQGFSQAQAERLAKPYTGAGHHSAFPKRSKVPERWKESEFNVLKPDMSTGDFYELHAGVDKHYWGSGFSKEIGGPGWSAKRLGFEKYDPLKRIWLGTPGPLKARIGGSAAALGSWVEDNNRGEREQ